MIDEEFEGIESRLRNEAARLAKAAAPAAVSPEQLLNRRNRQRAARRKTRAAVSIGLMVVVGGCWWMTSNWRDETRLNNQLVVESPVARDTGSPPPAAPSVAATTHHKATQDDSRAIQAWLKQWTSAGALPVVLVRTDASGKRIVVPALYVPPRQQRVEFSQLKPVQQRAVMTLLGLQVNRRGQGI